MRVKRALRTIDIYRLSRSGKLCRMEIRAFTIWIALCLERQWTCIDNRVKVSNYSRIECDFFSLSVYSWQKIRFVDKCAYIFFPFFVFLSFVGSSFNPSILGRLLQPLNDLSPIFIRRVKKSSALYHHQPPLPPLSLSPLFVSFSKPLIFSPSLSGRRWFFFLFIKCTR